MRDIAGFAGETVKMLDQALKDVRIPKATLGPCPVCGHEIVENRKGYSCWARDDPGCGFVIWKAKAGKQLPLAIARELIRTGYTARPVTGFRGRSRALASARISRSSRRPTANGAWSSTRRGPRTAPSRPTRRPSRQGAAAAASVQVAAEAEAVAAVAES